MAGRPAAGSSTGLLGILTVVICLFLATLVTLVVLWTNVEDLKDQAQDAKNDLQRVVRAGEMQGAYREWYDAAGTGKSMVGLMGDELTAMNELLIGDASLPAPKKAGLVDREELRPLWDQMRNDTSFQNAGEITGRPLVPALTALYGAYRNKHQAWVQSQELIEEQNQRIAQLIADTEQLQTEFDEASEGLKTEVAKVEESHQESQRKKDNLIEGIQQRNKERATEIDQERQSWRDEMGELETEIDKKQSKIVEYQEKLREFQIVPQARTAARRADGHVIRAEPGDKYVFIDLGVDDHLTLGLRFSVYSPDPGVPSSGLGKGAIEVVSIGEEVSQCRIVHMNPWNPILKEDLIANPVYDRDRRLTFVVLGTFDLDYDGFDDSAGKENIEAVIRDAGGELRDQITAKTDFVVAGARPPVVKLGQDPSEENLAIYEAQLKRAEQYEKDLSEALSLSIPVLTQETFLNFLGRRG